MDGKLPELWDPMTGETTKLLQFSHKDGKTQLTLDFEPHGSAFIVFRYPSQKVTPVTVQSGAERNPFAYLNAQNKPEMHVFENGNYDLEVGGKTKSITVKDLPASSTLTKPWTVQFNPAFGLDQTLTFNELVDWKDHELEAVRHYSGTAVYSTTFGMSKMPSDRVIELYLGTVEVAATVTLNDKTVGTVWKKPYRLDITDYLVDGENTLSVKVANLWSNRLIGDEQYPDKAGVWRQRTMPEWYTNNDPQPETERFSFCAYHFYEKGDPLLPSGLLGPVKIMASKKLLIK